MTVKELYEIFKGFKENEFAHLVNDVKALDGRVQKRIDRIMWLIIAGLIGIVGNFITIIMK